MATRADIVAEARSWLGTPYHHQGRTRGLGCDCGGLVGGVAVALGVLPADWWATAFEPRFGGYGKRPNGTLRDICEAFMVPAAAGSEPQPGQILLMQFLREPQHLAIVADYVHGGLSVVHALSRVGLVREHRLAPELRRAVVAVYDFPGVSA